MLGHHLLAALAALVLLLDPMVGLLETRLEVHFRLPPEHLPDQLVVRVPPTHPLRGVELVVALELDPGDALDDLEQRGIITEGLVSD